MHTTHTTDRWTEIRDIHQQYHFHYQIMGGAALVLVGILLGAAIFAEDEGYATNLYTEILSIIITVFILNLLAERREEARRIRDLKAQLVRDAGSRSNDVAIHAVDELRHHGWLTGEDGLLKGTDLGGANLQGVNLRFANLQGADLNSANLQGVNLRFANLQGASLLGADLQGADLQEANLVEGYLWFTNLQGAYLLAANLYGVDLWKANLQGAHLWVTNLQGAYLREANLQGASLEKANLQGADLQEANLQGAHLWSTNLQGANLENAKFDEDTILPDRTHWTPDTDLTRFTDPDHPNFWRSDDLASPAYWDE